MRVAGGMRSVVSEAKARGRDRSPEMRVPCGRQRCRDFVARVMGQSSRGM